MALVDSVADGVQLALNAAALIGGGVVWKMYFENLKATIGSKEAEVSLANKQTDYWRERAGELEKRSPEAVERVLAERIAIRTDEIMRLAEDKEQGSQELQRVEEEVKLLQRTLEQTKGFRAMLEMERPDPGDTDDEEYLEYLEGREDRVVEVEVVHLGNVGVDSGKLMITDPCYVDSEWLHEPFEDPRVYTDAETGATLKWGEHFIRFDEPLDGYDATPEALIGEGRLVQVPPPRPDTFHYSYNGACQATSSAGYGELVYEAGHPGAGVVFQSGWGDGDYPVYGEKHDGRIMRVYLNCGAEPSV